MTRALRVEDRAGTRIGLAGTAVVHAGIVVAALAMSDGAPPFMGTTYQVQLIAAPAPSQARRVATEAVAPPPPPTAPTQDRSARTAPVTPPAAPRATPRTEPAPQVANPVQPLPGETPGTGSNIANVNLQGKPFPFPEYLENLVEQVYRRWPRPVSGSPLQAEVGFTILRDGTVKDIKFVRSSRNYSFDLEAMGAIESAARVRAFGPLPAGFPEDALQISFYFAPRPGR